MFQLAFVGALLVKTIVDNIKFLWDVEEDFSKTRFASLVISILLFTLFGVDILSPIGFDIPYFDGVYEVVINSAISGIVLAGGSNILHDIMKTVQK